MLALNGTSLCLHELFAAQARRTPHETAVVFEGQALTYAELERRAELLAGRLRSRGLPPEARVALLLDRSAALIVGILGILKAGAAYVPIDAGYPRARIGYILQDSGAAVLVSDSALLEKAPPGGPDALCLDTLDWTQPKSAEPRAAAASPGSLAYVIYTSGSTGHPKGVCVEHRNIVNYVLGISERLGLAPGMHYALVSTIAADLGNTVIFPALATGGCLHVISQERAESQALLSEYFVRNRIDVLKITPSHLASLQGGNNPEQVMPRQRLILGGEPAPLDRVERLLAMRPECEIYNHYGPTETTVGVLACRVPRPLPDTPARTLPLGTPLANSRVYVVTSDGRPAAAGEQGELWIGGAGVARGYLNRPELTAAKFIPNPFEADGGTRVYRTGDIGRLLPDGAIEFCGRVDNQVKLGGYRVELEEIEQALREHPAVRDAAVVAREEDSGDRKLAAYVVPHWPDQPLWALPAVHVLPEGMCVAHLNRNETDYIYNEIFVLQAYLRHGISIQEGDCIIDAGANIGLFTVFASRIARNLRILSFEPNPAAFACLEANARAWGAGVTCLPMGLSAEEKLADMTFFEGMSLLSGFYADAAVEHSVVETYVYNQQPAPGDGTLAGQISELIDQRLQAKTVSAQLRTLSNVIAEHGIEHIDLLKINVEKSELDVLHGLAPHDWPKVRQVVAEVDLGGNLEPIVALLSQHGFEVHVEQDALLDKTELCYVYAVRPGESRRLVREQAPGAHLRQLPPPDPHVIAPAGLRRCLGEHLPRYMVPQAYTLMEKLPLTANGKIDRQALPRGDSAPAAAAFIRPRTGTEAMLAAIWSELLQVENIGVHDDFFDLGGQSLVAIRMVARIRDAFGIDVPLRNLFERPTLAGLSEVIDGLAWIGKPGAVAAGREGREEIVL